MHPAAAAQSALLLVVFNGAPVRAASSILGTAALCVICEWGAMLHPVQRLHSLHSACHRKAHLVAS